MSSYYGTEVVAIIAKGSAETEFVSATFEARVTMTGKTGPEAKTKAIPVIEKIKVAIKEHAEEARIDTTRLKTTFDVDIHHDRQTGGFAGYKATYVIKFTGKNVAAATAVHDALTSIESVQAPTPVFNIDDSSDIYARAFTDAVVKARSRFDNQCKALDQNSSDYGVKSWSIQDEEPRGKTLGFTEEAGPKPGIEPGKATLDMRVTILFARKLK